MPLVLAHRGARLAAPDNTLDAFVRARAHGAHGVELDVHRCADGHLVVHHDADGGGVGLLVELELAVIRERAPAIPTLVEVLDAMEGLLVNVEIKNLPVDPGYDPGHRAADTLLELLAERGGRDRVLVSSFNIETLDRVRDLDPSMPTGFLTFAMGADTAIGVTVEHGHDAWHPDRATALGDPVAVVARAHAAGLRVHPWTVNEPAELARLGDAGADAVITDVPDVALSVFEARPG